MLDTSAIAYSAPRVDPASLRSRLLETFVYTGEVHEHRDEQRSVLKRLQPDEAATNVINAARHARVERDAELVRAGRRWPFAALFFRSCVWNPTELCRGDASQRIYERRSNSIAR